jgi:hypothetical protein
MTWTAPMTAVAGSVFTAAQFNTFIRDNLNECPTAKATTSGSHFAGAGTNSVAERITTADYIATSQNTTSTSYTDLTTVGPTVTVTTGPAALVAIYNANVHSTGAASALMSFEVSGASSQSASDTISIGTATTVGSRAGATFLVTGLTGGSNTFRAKYRVGAGTGTFVDRRIVVMPF